MEHTIKREPIFDESAVPSRSDTTGRHTLTAVPSISLSDLGSDEYISEEEARARRESLERRPSYRKIFNDLSASEIDHGAPVVNPLITMPIASASSLAANINQVAMNYATAMNSDLHLGGFVPTFAASAAAAALLHSAAQPTNPHDILPFSVPGSGRTAHSSTVVANTVSIHPESDSSVSPLISPVSSTNGQLNTGAHDDSVASSSGSSTGVVITHKREVRLFKNREAAKECRRKKKEYVKCLENRVQVLENQNKQLIEELKSLKELYCRKHDG